MLARFFLALVALLAVVLLARPASAAPPELRTQIDAETVGVGDEVRFTLQATTTTNETLGEPRPGNTPGFSVRGTSMMPTSTVTIFNGVRTDKRGVTTTWTLRAERTGTFTIGPPSITVNGTRYTGRAARIVVVPAAQSPKRSAPVPDPFGPWRGMFGIGDDHDDALRDSHATSADPKLSLDAPRAPAAFLHATLDKTRAVVGEQVTLSVLLYTDLTSADPDFTDVHEATASDFVKRSLLDNDMNARFLGVGLVAGVPYSVKLIRKSALFPLKTGDLDIGPMELSLVRGRGPLKRESEPLHVRVAEPPIAGRPPGYAIGDVGHYDLSCEITPRDIDRGGAVGVTIDLGGTGNLPAQLPVPARAGVEWLTPETHDKIGAIRGTDRFGGKRTFSYVVRVLNEGEVDLGEILLPFWDPDTRAYAVARAPLGTIHVKPNGTPAVKDAPVDLLPGIPDARPSFAGVRPAPKRLADAWLFWLGLGAAPLAYPFFAGARAAVRSAKTRRTERAADPRTDMKARLAEAEARSRGADPRAADAATARAIEASAIACARVNLRGTTGAAAEDELTKAGVEEGDAQAIVALHRECEAARFSPEASGAADAKARWGKARALIHALEKAPRASAA